MKIINVIESHPYGILDITSFPITNPSKEIEIVKHAENLFSEKVFNCGAKEENIQSYVEDGQYSNYAQYTVSLVWSEVKDKN